MNDVFRAVGDAFEPSQISVFGSCGNDECAAISLTEGSSWPRRPKFKRNSSSFCRTPTVKDPSWDPKRLHSRSKAFPMRSDRTKASAGWELRWLTEERIFVGNLSEANGFRVKPPKFTFSQLRLRYVVHRGIRRPEADARSETAGVRGNGALLSIRTSTLEDVAVHRNLGILILFGRNDPKPMKD